jgi:hypothetical protein
VTQNRRFCLSRIDALINLIARRGLCCQIPVWLDCNTLTRLRVATLPQRRPACQGNSSANVQFMGVCKSTMQPVWDGKAFQPRLMLPLSLTWDHRVIDGAAAARFNVYLGQILGDFRRVLL